MRQPIRESVRQKLPPVASQIEPAVAVRVLLASPHPAAPWLFRDVVPKALLHRCVLADRAEPSRFLVVGEIQGHRYFVTFSSCSIAHSMKSANSSSTSY